MIGMCVKGGALTTSQVGLFSFTLPSISPSSPIGGEVTSFAGSSPSSTYTCPQNLFNNNILIIKQSGPIKYRAKMDYNFVDLNHSITENNNMITLAKITM
ncbi:MAG: hypothetical protein V5A88_04920 [Candidatus Thermoplasmatota archaeon]